MRILFSTIFLLTYLFMFAKSEEPHCSKYDFEEKALEKMVRVEFQMERMKTEMEQTVKSVDTKLKELQTLKDQIVTPTVAFKAKLNSRRAAHTHTVLVFPTVLFSEGDAYNNVTGIFTATTNGTYFFTVALCVRYRQVLTVEIKIDGEALTRTIIYNGNNTSHDCKTVDTVAVLQDKQNVWVQTYSPFPDKTIENSQFLWNTFSGVFLHK